MTEKIKSEELCKALEDNAVIVNKFAKSKSTKFFNKALSKEEVELEYKKFCASSGVEIQDDNLDFGDKDFSIEFKVDCPDVKIIFPQERTFKCPHCKNVITWFVNLEYDKKKSKFIQ